MSVDITVNTNVRVVDLSVTFDGNTVNLQPTITIGGGGGGVQSVTGNLIDNTDPLNPVANAASAISSDANNAAVLGSDDKVFVNKIGTTSYATITGAVNVDVSALTDDVYYLLTGNTTITWTNTPALGQSFIRSFLIKSTTAETLTLPAADISKGTYSNDGSLNQITIKFSNYPTEGLKIVQFINNA